MAKENKSKLIIWALVALVIGVILGLVITNITTTGQAKSVSNFQVAPRTSMGAAYNYVLYQTLNPENRTEQYFLWTQEDIQSNVSAKINKQSSISYPNNGNDSGVYFWNNSKIFTERKEGYYYPYSVQPETMIFIPKLSNSQSINYWLALDWVFENGTTKSEFMQYVVNQNNNQFIEVNSINIDCSTYQINHTMPTGINSLQYNLNIFDPTNNWSEVYWENWSEERINPNGTQSGNLPQGARDILQNSNQYYIQLMITTYTSENMITTAYKGDFINCQNGTIRNPTKSEQEIINSKLGSNTDKVKSILNEIPKEKITNQ